MVKSHKRLHRCSVDSMKVNASLSLGIRKLICQLFEAQEEERIKISHELQEEIIQTLVGVGMRLVALKQDRKRNRKDFKNEIVNMQHLVVRSEQSMRHLAHKFSHP